MTYEAIDFRKPGRVSEDIGQMLFKWQHGSREAIEFGWGRYISSALEIAPAQPAPLTGAELRTLDESVVAYRVDIDRASYTTLILVNRSLAVALVQEVVGNPASELPEQRQLTDIELTCLDYLLEDLTRAIQSGQSLKPPRKLTLTGRVQLKELHTQFPENVTNTDVSFQVGFPYGSERIHWVLPQEATLDLVASFATHNSTDAQNRKDLEKLLRGAPAELRVRLGDTKVQLSRLANLKQGDVIVLDQRIDDPLIAELGGQPMFRGWGCKVGKQQVFQIDSEISAPADLLR